MSDTIQVTKSSMPPYEEYIEAIKPLWDTHWLTNMGQFHNELEKRLEEYLNVNKVSLIVNGHMALELAIQAFNFEPGSEVITTPFTFVSTTHAIIRNGLTPVFCDIKETDGTIDETKIEQLITDKTVAIVPVHVYGNVCNVEEIKRIADKHKLKVIYDGAHAFGEKINNRSVGSFGDATIYSFHATKVFNTIEGGAVVCNDSALYEKLYNLKNFGIRGEELVVSVGTNAKMNEFCAIMGLCNLKNIDKSIETRKEVYNYYIEGLKDIKNLTVFSRYDNVEYNYSYMPIIVDKYDTQKRNKIYDSLKENSVLSRKYFYPLTSDEKCFGNSFKSAELNTARSISERVLCLPIYEGLSKEDIQKIIDIIRRAL